MSSSALYSIELQTTPKVVLVLCSCFVQKVVQIEFKIYVLEAVNRYIYDVRTKQSTATLMLIASFLAAVSRMWKLEIQGP